MMHALAVGALVIQLFLAGAAAEEPELVLMSECTPGEACIPMLLNFGPRGEGALISTKPLPEGFTAFIVRVRGKLADAEPREHRVLIRGYTDGIECCDFGQTNVAVLGYSQQSQPILATSSGSLTVEDQSLRVGCSGCVKVFDSKSGKVLATYPSPSWDLTLTGHRKADLSASELGELYIRTSSTCMQLVPDGLFRVVEQARCASASAANVQLTVEDGACT